MRFADLQTTYQRKVASTALLLLLAACGKVAGNGSSKTYDEGFHRAQGSFDDFVNKLSNFYGDKFQIKGNSSQIRKALLSTFQIACPDLQGSGVFVGADGSFVTAAHVLNRDRIDCVLRINNIDNSGNIIESEVPATLFALRTKTTPYHWDLTYGKASITAPAWLSLAQDPATFAAGRATLAMGYPVYTLRDGTSEVVPAAEAEKAIAAECTEFVQDLEDLKPYMVPSMAAELSEKIARVQDLCSNSANNRNRGRATQAYDVVPNSMRRGLFASLGRSFSADNYTVLSDADIHNGMSGGPLIDLESGSLLGVLSFSALHRDKAKLEKQTYFGGAAWQKVSETRLAEISAQGEYLKKADVCVCDWNIFQDLGRGLESRLLSTSWIGLPRPAPACQALSGALRISNVQGYASRLEGCRLAAASVENGQLEGLRAGSFVRIGNDQTPEIVRISTGIDKYFAVQPELAISPSGELVFKECTEANTTNVIVGDLARFSASLEHSVVGRSTENDRCDGFGGDMYTLTIGSQSLGVFVHYNVTGTVDLASIAQVFAAAAAKPQPEGLRFIIVREAEARDLLGPRADVTPYWWSRSGLFFFVKESTLKNADTWQMALLGFASRF